MRESGNHGFKLHFRVRGVGAPVLLIHGLGLTGADWALQVSALQSHFRVIIPDLPGCGQSEQRSGGYAIASLANTLWNLVDDLDEPQVNIVGYSLGGAVALEMALQRPDAVPRLALINTLATYRADDWRKWCEARVTATLVRVLGMRNMARLMAGRTFPEPWQQQMRDRAVAVIGAVPAASYLAMAAALECWSATERLDQLRSRTLLIAAEHDFTPLAEKRAIAARIGANLVVVRGSRHGTPFDSIELTNASLLAHLHDEPLPACGTWARDELANAPAWLLAAGIASEHAACATDLHIRASEA
jgi:pimeloyl-ACP methyl ester carboxylesterase